MNFEKPGWFIAKDDSWRNEVYPCGICCLLVKANSAVCVQYHRWIHSKCAGVKKVTTKVYPCGICCLLVKANSAVCVQYHRWIHSKCAGVKNVTTKVV